MIWWLTFGPYVVMGLVAWRLAAGHFAWSMAKGTRNSSYCDDCYNAAIHHPKNPSNEQWFGAVCMGLMVACLWPLAIVFTFHLPLAIGAEAKARDNAKGQRIKELERELELAA